MKKIGKAGARFDFDKAKWFNQQYIMQSTDEELVAIVKPILAEKGINKDDTFLTTFVQLMKERVVIYSDFWDNGYYFFTEVQAYDEKNSLKKWKPENQSLFDELRQQLRALDHPNEAEVEAKVKSFMDVNELGFGAVLPILRIGVTGTMQGPSIFAVMALLGMEEVDRRLEKAFAFFNELKKD